MLCKGQQILRHIETKKMIKMISLNILRKSSNDISESGILAITVDGTKCISAKEQKSISIRYLDALLCVHKEFMGLRKPWSNMTST